ncbi:hypothetical protein BJ878DRAFT_77210 [Calycina marina]|uniref:Uncharacterized protein n=1 Tax=Calycina marina TaxID=1763456 RepID=A0A9P8CK41_9HELO|nr:hypothetical protein BJ878DRAFT_77210 [Calycina marina]
MARPRNATTSYAIRKTEVVRSDDAAPEIGEPIDSSALFVPEEPQPKVIKRVNQAKKRKTEPVASLARDYEYNEELEEQPKKKSRKPEPVMRTKNDEYDEDIGRVESQDFLTQAALTKLEAYEKNKKKKSSKENAEYMANFKALLEQGKGQLNSQLENLTAASSNTEAAFLKTFQDLYEKATPFQNNPSRGFTGFATMHQKSIELVTIAEQLVAIFEDVEKSVADCDMVGVLDNDWRDENAAIENLLAEGYDVGIQKHREITSGEILNGDREVAQRVGPVFYSEERVVEGATDAWGEIAQKQKKAVKRLVKSIFVDAV